MRTDGDGLDLDALLNMSGGSVVGLLVAEDGFAAEGVDEGGASCRSNQRPGQTELQGRYSDSPVPEAPQTIRQN